MKEKTVAEQLNDYAIAKIQSLTDHKYFEIIEKADEEIALNDDPFDKSFYLHQQDQLSQAYGEILVVYSKLRARLKTHIAVRKFQMKIEAETNKTKLPGNDILEGFAKAEIPELYKGTLILEGWVGRGENSIRTTRSHTYGDRKDNNYNKDED